MNRFELPPAVVAGMEGNGLGVARPLHAAGIPVIGVGAPEWNPAYLSRAVKIRRLKSWTKAGFIEGLLALGAELGTETPLLFTKDEAVLWASEFRDELARYFHFTFPPHDTILRLLDKNRFCHWAESAGWPVPRSWYINSVAELNEALKSIPYPAIVKPQLKNEAFRASWIQKAFRAESPEELAGAYTIISAHEPEVVVQEWIEGGDDRIAFVLGCWDRHSKPLGLFYGRKLRQWPLGTGNTAIAEPAPEAWAKAMAPLTEKIGSQCGFQGLNSIEFKVEAGTDRFLITEPTVCRSDYQSEVAVLNGVNLPLMAYADLTGSGMPPVRAAGPVRWIDSRADRKAGEKLIERGDLTREEWERGRTGKKGYLWFRPNDPLPWLGSFLPERVRRRI